MKRLFTAIVITLILFISPLCFAQIGVIPEGKTIPKTLISDPGDETFDSKTLIELESQALENNIKRVINYSVSITSLGNGFGTCSGVIIKNTPNESIVLSAKHCIGTAEELYIEAILVDTVGISIYDDLAYFKLNKMIPNKTAVNISEFVPTKGDLVVTIGYPSFILHIGIGEIQIKTKDWQIATIHLIPGCSGGGVFNEYGELVGIVWGIIGSEKELEKEESTTGIFERLEDIIDFVRKNKLLE